MMGMSLLINWLKLIGYAAGAMINVRGLRAMNGEKSQVVEQVKTTFNETAEFIKKYSWVVLVLIVMVLVSGFSFYWPGRYVGEIIAAEHCKATLDFTTLESSPKITVTYSESECKVVLEHSKLGSSDVAKMISSME